MFNATVSVFPFPVPSPDEGRQRVSFRIPLFSSFSASPMALPKAILASLSNILPPIPRITSPSWRTPSAGEPFSTLVIRIWRAKSVRRRIPHIQPLAPVGPRFQSCRSFFSPPRVRSGISGIFLWASELSIATTPSNTHNHHILTIILFEFILCFVSFLSVFCFCCPRSI